MFIFLFEKGIAQGRYDLMKYFDMPCYMACLGWESRNGKSGVGVLVKKSFLNFSILGIFNQLSEVVC